MSAAYTSHRIRAAVLLVVRVQYEQNIKRAFKHGVRLILKLRSLKHHVQKIAFVAEVVIRIGILHSDAMAVSERGNGWHFGDQPMYLFAPAVHVKNIFGVRIES